jgi:acyl-CoA thioesterase-1
MRLFLSVLAAFTLACTPGDPGGGPPSEQAFEGHEPAASVPREEAPVVVFFGTSLTAGLGLLREEDTYVARLAELAEDEGMTMRAVNAGVSGETSAGGLRRIDWVLREPLDVLFLELGANDGLRGQDTRATATNLRQIIAATRRRYPTARVLIAGMEAPSNLGIRYTQEFREVFPSVASTEGATLVPFILQGVAGVPELNQADGIHPTAEGHRRMADIIWPFLRTALQEWHRDRDRQP